MKCPIRTNPENWPNVQVSMFQWGPEVERERIERLLQWRGNHCRPQNGLVNDGDWRIRQNMREEPTADAHEVYSTSQLDICHTDVIGRIFRFPERRDRQRRIVLNPMARIGYYEMLIGARQGHFGGEGKLKASFYRLEKCIMEQSVSGKQAWAGMGRRTSDCSCTSRCSPGYLCRNLLASWDSWPGKALICSQCILEGLL